MEHIRLDAARQRSQLHHLCSEAQRITSKNDDDEPKTYRAFRGDETHEENGSGDGGDNQRCTTTSSESDNDDDAPRRAELIDGGGAAGGGDTSDGGGDASDSDSDGSKTKGKPTKGNSSRSMTMRVLGGVFGGLAAGGGGGRGRGYGKGRSLLLRGVREELIASRARAISKALENARLLRRAVHETYRGVNMLESFVSLNMEAFRKIIKKHDKLTGWQTQETYMVGLRHLRIFHDDEVGDLRTSLENAYLKIEEVLCLLEPDRWRRAAARGAGGAGSAVGGGGGGGGGGRSKRGGGRGSSSFTPGFYEVRRRRNELLAKLRQDTRGPGAGAGRRSGPQFLAGLALGAAFALGAMLVTRLGEACAAHPHSRDCVAVTSIAPVLRAPLLVCVHVVLYGAAVQAWSVTRVNSGFIFEARRGTELPATGAVLAGSLAACAWLIVSMVLVGRTVARVTEDDVDDVHGDGVYGDDVDVDLFRAATGALCCMILFFVVPWPERLMRGSGAMARFVPFLGDVMRTMHHPPNSTRRFFLSALGRGLCAPAYRVRMIDFFLMDQVISQTAALRDFLVVVFSACGSFFVAPQDGWIRYAPIVTLLPGWLRLMQVLRRFRDDGNFVHLINAGKYGSGIVAISAGLCLRYVEEEEAQWGGSGLGGSLAPVVSGGGARATGWRHAYNVATYAAVIYGGTWDFFQDWSVFSLQRPTRQRDYCWSVKFLERRLMIRSRWKYFVAIGVNVVLRNLWIVASVPASGTLGRLGGEVWMTAYATLEVFRRCMWNYFRVENEHTTNCGMFRATLEVPLPFEDGELTDDEEEGAEMMTIEEKGDGTIATNSVHAGQQKSSGAGGGDGGGGSDEHGSSDDESDDGEHAREMTQLSGFPGNSGCPPLPGAGAGEHEYFGSPAASQGTHKSSLDKTRGDRRSIDLERHVSIEIPEPTAGAGAGAGVLQSPQSFAQSPLKRHHSSGLEAIKKLVEAPTRR